MNTPRKNTSIRRCICSTLARLALSLGLAVGGITQTSFAAFKTWDGGGGDGTWSTSANWDADTAPAATGDNLIFAGVTNLSAVNTHVTALATSGTALTFASGAGSFVLSGSTITMGGGGGGGQVIISQQSASNQEISYNITLSGGNGDRSIVFASGAGSLTLSGNMNFSNDWLFPTTTAGTIILSGSNTGDGKGTNALTSGSNIMKAMMRNNVAGTQLVLGSDYALGNSGTGSVSAGTASFRGILAQQQLNISTSGGDRNLAGSSLLINANNITFNGTNNLTIGNIINQSGDRDFVVSGSGGVTVASSISLSNDQTGRQLFINLTGSGGMIVNGSIYDTFHTGGVTTGTSTFRKGGAGLLILNGSSSYTGNTQVDAGTLRATNANAFGSTKRALINGSTAVLDLRNDSSVTFSGSGGALNVITSVNGASMNVDRATGAGAAVDLTIGTLTLNSAVTNQTNFTGSTNASLVTGAVTTGTSASGTETINNNITGGGSLTLPSITSLRTGTPTLSFTGSGNTVVTGAITQTGTTALTYAGTGKLTLSGSNSYGGTTTLSSGTLGIGNANALGTGTLAISGGAVFDNSTAGALSIANNVTLSGNSTFAGSQNLTVTGSTTVSGGNRDLTVSANTLTLGGPVDFGSRYIAKLGSGKLVLNSAGTGAGAVATMAGITGLSRTLFHKGGTVEIGNAAAFGTGVINLDANGAVFQSNTSLTGGSAVANTVIMTNNATIGGSNDLELSGTFINNNLALTVNNTAATTLSGPVFISGSTASTQTLTVNVAGTAGATTISGPIGDFYLSGTAGNFTKSGSGTLIVSGNNSYTGATTVNGGTLSVSSLANGGVASNIGASSNAASSLVLDGGTLSYTGTSVSIDRGFTYGSGNGGTIEVTNSATNLEFTGIAAQSVAGVSSLTKTGAGTLTLSGTADNSNFGLIVNAGEVDLNKSDTRRAITRNGVTINAGTVKITGTGGDQIQNSQVVTLTSGTFDMNGHSEIIGNLAGAGGIVTSASAATLTIGVTSGAGGDAQTYSGSIQGSVALTKANSGTSTLAGANTYTGLTNVIGGTLQFAQPNASVVTLTGSLNIATSGTAVLTEHTGGAGNVKVLDITGLTIDGTTAFAGGGFKAGDEIVDSPSFGGLASPAPVPEPGTVGLLAVGAIGGLLLRRRSRKSGGL